MENCKGVVISVLRRSYENSAFVEVLNPLFDNSDQAYDYMETYMLEEAAEYAEIYGEDNVKVDMDRYEIIIRRGTETAWIPSSFDIHEVF